MTETVADLIIYNAGELLTLGGHENRRRTGAAMADLGIVKNGALAAKNGQILMTGATDEVLSSYHLAEDGQSIDAGGRLVMPGLVDCHTHLISYGSREDEFGMRMAGVPRKAIRDQGGGIYRSVRMLRQASWWDLLHWVRGTLDQMLLNGTTVVDARSSYGLNLVDEIKSLEVARALNESHPVDLVPTFQGAHIVAEEFRSNPDAFVDHIVDDVLPEVARRGLARLCDIGCEDNGIDDCFSVEQARRVLTEAKRLGLTPRVGSELTSGGIRLAIEMKAISVEHVSAVDSMELIQEMAANGVGANLLAASEFGGMFNHYTDPRPFIEAGVPVAIATNFNPGSYCESMQMAIRLSCFGMKMRPEEALVAATINGAYVLSVADRVGSLEPGKQADVLIMNASNYLQMVYRFGVNLVDKVIKNGQVVVDKGQLQFSWPVQKRSAWSRLDG
jgi:imidazolonepropionase